MIVADFVVLSNQSEAESLEGITFARVSLTNLSEWNIHQFDLINKIHGDLFVGAVPI